MVTAEELLSQLADDPEYQAKMRERDKSLEAFRALLAKDEEGLVHELQEAGFQVTTVWDLVNADYDYIAAVPVLKKYLQTKRHPRVLEGIARSLAMKALSEDEELWHVLCRLYNDLKADDATDNPQERGAEQGVAAALSEIATVSRVQELQEIIAANPDKKGGNGFLSARLEALRSADGQRKTVS